MESSEPMRKPITLAHFPLPITEEEDELQVSNCNHISEIGHPPPSDLDDSDDDDWVPPTMSPPMDSDYQDNDRELEPDEKEYLSNEVLNENDYITDPFFYLEIIPEIEVQIYNPRLPEPSD